jgi:hypothetical protein
MNYLFFGQFLRKEGLISDEDIFQARTYQKKHNRRIGELARDKKGWLTSEQVERILVMQEENMRKFGEVATILGYLDEEQVDELLREIDDKYIFFGESLVRLGVVSEETMLEKLKEFNKMGRKKSASSTPAKEGPRRKRLSANDCELIHTCLFFNDKMAEESGEASLLKVRYCMGDFRKCARYLVYEVLGPEDRHEDLLPDQRTRAVRIIQSMLAG